MNEINKPFPELDDASAEQLLGMVWWLASELSSDWEPWQLVVDAQAMWEDGLIIEENQQSKWYAQQYESGNIWRAIYTFDLKNGDQTIEICYNLDEAVNFLREEKAAKRLQVIKAMPTIQCPDGTVISGKALRKLINTPE